MSETITIRTIAPPRIHIQLTPSPVVNVQVRGRIITPSLDFIENETPSGTVDGSNGTFTSQYNFVPASVEAFINGLKQKPIVHYITMGTQTIIFTDSPQTVDQILINYQKA
jgi:hypothetical protein